MQLTVSSLAPRRKFISQVSDRNDSHWPESFRRRRWGRRSVLRNLCLGSRNRRHFLLSCILQAILCLDRSLLCCRVLFSSGSIDPGAVGSQGSKLGRELLYFSLSFSLGLRRVGRLTLRLNDAAVREGFFPFGYFLLLFIHCFLSLNQCFLACIQLRFPLRKLRFCSRILLLAGANHRKSDEQGKDKHSFHIRTKLWLVFRRWAKKTEAQPLVKRNLTLTGWGLFKASLCLPRRSRSKGIQL